MISHETRPRLAQRARLQFDRHTGKHMLLYPEKGLTLNASAAAILQLCDGQNSVGEIIAKLAAGQRSTPAERVEQDVLTFLEGLAQRALIKFGD